MQKRILKVFFKALCVILAIFVTFVIVYAQGTIELPKTGQTISYYPGDDGDLQKGVPWPSPRFTDHGDGTITDNLTGLMWVQGPVNIKRTWADAFDYVKNFFLAGYTDWRVPNINELESLINAAEFDTATWLNGQGFSIQDEFYWTSTTHSTYPVYAFTIRFSDSFLNYADKSTEYSVCPVRGTPSGPAQLWSTGQTKCYDTEGSEIDCANTGQDGELRQGVPWPNPRFMDNQDGTVIDRLTGLMWTQDGNAPGPEGCSPGVHKTWQGALDYIYCLNNYDFSGYLGYTSWRMPNRKELRSLLNYENINTPEWLTDQGFINVQPAEYWTSTSLSTSSEGAWIIRMLWGDVFGRNKTYFRHVWPVRGPDPSLDIKANGSDGPFTVPYGTNLTVTITLEPGSYVGEEADWWVVATTPFGLYWYTLDRGWVRSDTPIRVYGGPLFNLSPFEVLNISGLPVGPYTFFFGVDMLMNGSLDLAELYYDSVNVTIELE